MEMSMPISRKELQKKKIISIEELGWAISTMTIYAESHESKFKFGMTIDRIKSRTENGLEFRLKVEEVRDGDTFKQADS